MKWGHKEGAGFDLLLPNAKILPFPLSEMGNHWKILSRERKNLTFVLERMALAAVWRIDCVCEVGAGVEGGSCWEATAVV